MKIKKLTFTLAFIITIAAMFFACGAPVKFPPPAEGRAAFEVSGGAVLIGKFVPPATQDKLTFIMLHGLASAKEEWLGFAAQMEKEGYGYFLVDLRGHGESTKDKSGREVSYKYFLQPAPDSEWSKMPDDLAAAVKFLKKKKGLPENKIGLIGASLGANVCLIYAAKNKNIPLTILLSPGWEYAGLTTGEGAKNYGKRPVLIASSPLDKYAYESSGVIFDTAKRGGAETAFIPGEGARHGVQMFDGPSGKTFSKKLIDWIILKR